MRERVRRWVLLSGDRYGVAVVTLLLMIGVLLVPDLPRVAIRDATPLFYAASAIATGNVTLITVVVAINQVVLAQELESPGSLRDEIEATADYRRTTLDGQTPSVEPSTFLRQLAEQTRERARSLEDLLPEPTDGGRDGDRLLTDLPDHCEEVHDRLEHSSEDLSNVVVPILGADYADYIHDCHRIQAGHEGDDHEQLHDALDSLASDLENLTVARQYFTTMFIKRELATLSRSLLYIGVLAVSAPLALLVQFTAYTGSPPLAPRLLVLVVLAGLFGLAPLALLIAFVLRIATVAQYIAGITPFES